MIEVAKESDRDAIKQLWQICFKEDPKYIDYYFKNLFVSDHCYVIRKDDKVVSSIIRNPHAIMFHGRILQASMLLGMCTHPDYRHQGHMHTLMEAMIDATSHSELMTFIRTNDVHLYEPFGFRGAFIRTKWSVQRNHMKKVPIFGVGYDVKALDMLKVYSAYIRRFNGFYTRDLQDFVEYRKQIITMGGKIIGYYNGQGRIDGYASFFIKDNACYIDELVYLDSIALTKLLSQCFVECPTIHFHVSHAENFKALFPNATHSDFVSTMVRINNYDLYNKLFSCQVSSVKEAMAILKKPLNQNESH